MKPEEKDYLILEKTNNGKSLEQARKEIKKLELSQIKFKDLEKQLINKDRIITGLNNQIEKLRKHNFKILSQTREKRTENKIKEIKNIDNNIEVLKALDRIFCLFSSEKRIGLSDLEKTARVKPELCKKILSLLIRNNFIKEIKEKNNRYNTLYLERI